MNCSAFSCVSPIPVRSEMTQQFLLKFPTTKFHEDPLSGCRAVTRDTNKNSRGTQLSVRDSTAATFRLISSQTRMGLSKTKSADMCREKGPITGRLDNNEHNVKWRRKRAPRQWSAARRVTCRIGENEMWRKVTRCSQDDCTDSVTCRKCSKEETKCAYEGEWNGKINGYTGY
jgi:hypothetical protein